MKVCIRRHVALMLKENSYDPALNIPTEHNMFVIVLGNPEKEETFIKEIV